MVTDVWDADAVAAGFDRIRDNLRAYNTRARFEGVRIQPMVGTGHDMFVGGKIDPAFGPVVFFGMGGIFIELLNDTANSLCPVGAAEVERKLHELKASRVLKGARGESPGDVAAFIDGVVRVSHLLHRFPQIRELDINPLRVFEKGVMALDCRMRVEEIG